jgi:polyisoprenyl-phosphate glycosyltransferase
MKTVTLIIPVFNEAAAIEQHLPMIIDALVPLTTVHWKILLIDDGSTDNTLEKLKKLSATYQNLQFISFNRNFGKEAAMLAGLKYSDSDAVIVMDSDLQHPPALIPQMLALWQQGVAVVEAYKISRGKESWLSKWLARGFYRIFRTLAEIDITNHSDFKLLDRHVVEIYCQLPERKRFFRGMIHWFGFATAQLPFTVPAREHGVSAWSKLKLLKFSLHALTSFSSLPLQLITLFGIFCFFLSIFIGSIALYHKISGVAVSGFTTVILLILLIGSLLMFALGLLGIYVAQIYDEIKQRPIYLINWQNSHFSQPDPNSSNSCNRED